LYALIIIMFRYYYNSIRCLYVYFVVSEPLNHTGIFDLVILISMATNSATMLFMMDVDCANCFPFSMTSVRAMHAKNVSLLRGNNKYLGVIILLLQNTEWSDMPAKGLKPTQNEVEKKNNQIYLCSNSACKDVKSG
jgi:hypothetical protein